MRHEPELEQMINLLALSADIMRKLANAQEGGDSVLVSNLANEIEGIADKLVDALYPDGRSRQ